MVRSNHSQYDDGLVYNDHNHGGVESYRVERTETIKRGVSAHGGHDGQLAHDHGSSTHEHNIHGHGHNKHAKDFNSHQHRLGENAVPALVQAFSGAIGASIANLAVHPLDLIIKRLQVQRQIEMQRRTQRETRSGVTAGSGGSHTLLTEYTTHTTGSQSSSKSQSPVHVISHSQEYSSSASGGGSYMGRTEWSQLEQVEMEGHYSGVIDAAQKIWAQEGLGGFYTGAVEETVGTMGSAFWYFAVYSYLRNKRLHKRHSQSLPILEELLIGLAAGSVSKIFLTPFNNIATRKQTHAMLYPNSKPTGIVTIYYDIMREKGITGFWSGYSASAFLSLNPTITFLLYESLKGFAGGKRRRLKGAETFLLAAVAKAIATGMTYPLAVARSRAQIPNEDDDISLGNLTSIGKVGAEVGKIVSRKARRSGNVIEMLVDIFKREGITGLYEGVLGEILRGFVSSGITMVIKESVHRTILSLYYFVMRAYNRSENHTFQSTTKLMAKDAYNKAGPRQKKLMNKAIEGVGKVTSSASHGKAKVAGLVGVSHATHKLSEVREKILGTTGIGNRREGSSHNGIKVAAATAAVAGLAAGAIHAHKRKDRQDGHGNAIVHTAHGRNERYDEYGNVIAHTAHERYDEHGNAIVHTAHERNERRDEHGNIIVHTARERVEEWRGGVDDDKRIHTAKVSHSHSHSGHVVDGRIHNGQASHSHSSHSHSGHVVDDRIHTGEMRQEVVETRTHSASGGVGSRIGRHNGVTEHTRIEERVQHGHGGSGSHSRRGSGVVSGVVGAVTGAALGHKITGHSHNEHTHSSSHGGLVNSRSHNEHAHSGSHGGLVNSHSHKEHSHSSGGRTGLASGVVGAVTGAVTGTVLGNRFSSHTQNQHSHSSGGHAGLASGVVGAVTGTILGNKLQSHTHNEHSHSSGGHAGLASGVVGAVTGAALGHKITGHSHNEHTHSSSHGGLVNSHSHNEHTHSGSHGGLVNSHSHKEHSHSSGGRTGLASGVVGAVTGAVTGTVLGNRFSSHTQNQHSHSSGGHAGLASGVVGAVTGTILGNKLQSHTHNEHSHSSGGHAGLASGAVGAVTGAVLGNKLTHSHTEHSHSSNNRGGLVSGVVSAVSGAVHKITGHSHNEHTHNSSHGGLVGTVAGATLGHSLSSLSHTNHSHGGISSGVVGAVTGAALGHKLPSHNRNEHGHGNGDVVTQTTKIVEEFGIMNDPRTQLMHDHHESHQAVTDSRARFGDNSHHEHSSIHESRGREHGSMGSAVTGAVERITGHEHSSHGRSHSGSRHNSSTANLMHKTNGSHNHGHGHNTHGHDGQTIIRTIDTTNQWRDEANAVEDLHQFRAASTVNEDSRSDFGETLHKGHSIVGHGHSNRFGDDAVVHGGHGHTVIEKTQITHTGETLYDGGRNSQGSHSHRHSESRSNFGDAALHTDGRTIVEKTEVTRIGGTTHNATPLGRFEDAGHQHHQQHHSHSSHGSQNHSHNNGVVIGNIGHDNDVTRTTVRETGWLGKKALIGNAASLNAGSINTAAATTGSNNVTTVTRTEEFWPVDEDARSSVYNFLEEDTKEIGGVKVEAGTTEGRWWSGKRGGGIQ